MKAPPRCWRSVLRNSLSLCGARLKERGPVSSHSHMMDALEMVRRTCAARRRRPLHEKFMIWRGFLSAQGASWNEDNQSHGRFDAKLTNHVPFQFFFSNFFQIIGAFLTRTWGMTRRRDKRAHAEVACVMAGGDHFVHVSTYSKYRWVLASIANNVLTFNI